ncbi:MAG: M1 family metallopeptidase [Pyrinomonadaceae bacterium]|nr:M1 family metallopeptidase [Pyrinomonadaceae bacterium]
MKHTITILIYIATALATTLPTFSMNSLKTAQDLHSYSNPEQIRVRHLDLNWEVLFNEKILKGTAVLEFERTLTGNHPLILDTRDLKITKVETSSDGRQYSATTFHLGKADTILGAPLTVQLPPAATRVRIEYQTSPAASGLQWLKPAQTAGRRQPFLFTQSQAIHARSWIPLQDSPQVRVTYNARVRTPRNLRAVMSAENDPATPTDGDYSFQMRQAVPSYLIALAVGDIAFRPLGQRTGVYAEPSVVERAATEFADTEKMVQATEALYGPYRWGRYDLLVLPPSFPFGGMENPRLTFATPTILAGDKSLVSLVAHELAHSWSGNLVTNATWRDFWLNEGFTTYLEGRIQEAVYGRARAEMEAVLGRQTLAEELATLDERDEILHVDLSGRDPDAGFTSVPYEKGALFLRHLEETFGRDQFDRFLRGYFDHFAFQSITTDDFIAYIKKNLLDQYPDKAARVSLDEWINKAGLPASAPQAMSDAFSRVEQQADAWLKGQMPAAAIKSSAWTTQEWLHFLKYVAERTDTAKLRELDQAFKLTRSGNAEIAHRWLLIAVRKGYEPAYPRLEEYLTSIGRRKLIKPLYDELVKTPAGRKRAEAIYRKARPSYHPIAVATIDQIVLAAKQ